MIYEASLPLNFIEHFAVRTFFHRLRPAYKLPCRKRLSTTLPDESCCQTVDGGAELVCRLNLWRMELFKYMKACQAAVARCRHHTVATRRL
jgi:hypothetical protein